MARVPGHPLSRRERAIEVVERARQTHVDWLALQQDDPDWESTTPGSKVGAPEHHQHYIKEYDLVLAELRGDPE